MTKILEFLTALAHLVYGLGADVVQAVTVWVNNHLALVISWLNSGAAYDTILAWIRSILKA